jgi:Fe-S cluster biogenesis protein NfuA
VSGPAERIEPLLAELEKSLAPGDFARVEELVRCVVALYGEGLARIPAMLADAGAPGSALWRRLAADEQIAGLLALHGLHPEPLAQRVERGLEKVRPALGSHGGDVHLVSVDEETGVVRLRLEGSCDGCPASSATLRHLVSDAIRSEAPEVAEIAVDDAKSDQLVPLYTQCEV